MMQRNEKQTAVQMLRFGVVGVSNTLITAAVIWLLLKQLYLSDYLSNIIGYVVGLVNSFVWNRKWTFKSGRSVRTQAPKFVLAFVISYLLQIANLHLLLTHTAIEAYICQLLSIAVYTISNFFINKYVTFKEEHV